MRYFDNLILQTLSKQILYYVSDEQKELQAKDVAEALGIGTRQVDAAVTKSLQRLGFIVRVNKLTPLKKKEYNVLKLTNSGKAYINFLNNNKKEEGYKNEI